MNRTAKRPRTTTTESTARPKLPPSPIPGELSDNDVVILDELRTLADDLLSVGEIGRAAFIRCAIIAATRYYRLAASYDLSTAFRQWEAMGYDWRG